MPVGPTNLFSTGSYTDTSAPNKDCGSDIRRGAFGNNGAATFALMTDGSSNCLAVGEEFGGKHKTSANYGSPGPHRYAYLLPWLRPDGAYQLPRGAAIGSNKAYITKAVATGSVEEGTDAGQTLAKMEPA